VRFGQAKAEPVAARPEAAANSAPPVATGSTEPIRPILVKTLTVRAGPQTASLAPVHLPSPAVPAPAAQAATPAKPVAAPVKQAAPAKVEAPAKAEALPPPPAARPAAHTVVRTAEPASAPAPALGFAPAPPPTPALGFAPAPAPTPVIAAPLPAPLVTAAAPAAAAPAQPKTQVRSGWSIQVGAFPAEQEAKQRLSTVQSKAAKVLAGNDPYTESVLKGGTTYYRARFAGFDQDKADAACKYLKRNDVECISVKN
jgi:D-alanyl-D-alanine carboxypeptidase